MQNNHTYLYNILLSSKFINYQNMQAQLGLEPSLAYYLFKYSNELFVNYPRLLNKPSLVVDTYKDMNISFTLLNISPTVIFEQYIDKHQITFKYLNYLFSIYHINHPTSILYKYNNSVTDDYNGIPFKLLTIEGAIAYCFSEYSQNYDLCYLMDACVLISIYITQFSKNILLSYLLQLGINVKKIMQTAMNSVKLLDFNTLFDFRVKEEEYRQSIHSTIGFCYGG